MSTEARGYKPDRLARAVRLVLSGKVERLGGSQYRIAGNTEPEYFVDLSAETPCYCRDMENRGRAILYQCKHILSAKLAGLDAGLIQVLADKIERDELAANASRRARPRRRTADTQEEG